MNKVILTALLFFITLPFLSQNTEKKSNPWKLKANVGFSYFEGNVEKLDSRLGLSVSKKDSIIEYGSAYNFIYGELNGDKNNLLHDFRFTVDVWPYHKVSPFAGVFVFSNLFKGFRLRNSYLLGAKYHIVEEDNTKISLSGALMYDNIVYGSARSAELEPDINDQIIRMSWRPKVKWKLSDQLTFQHISFWQPTIENLSNYILTIENGLDFIVKKNLSIGFDYLYYFNSDPPYNSVRKRDQKVLFSIKYSM